MVYEYAIVLVGHLLRPCLTKLSFVFQIKLVTNLKPLILELSWMTGGVLIKLTMS